MIHNIKHKGLNKLVKEGKKDLLPSDQIRKITIILRSLNAANKIEDLNLPGYRLHKLKGNLNDCYSITVTANYRIIFKFIDGNIYDIDYVDYH